MTASGTSINARRRQQSLTRLNAAAFQGFMPMMVGIVAATALVPAFAQDTSHGCSISSADGVVRIKSGADVVDLQQVEANILRVHVQPQGKTSPRTLVIDPALKEPALKPLRDAHVEVASSGDSVHITSSQLDTSLACAPRLTLSVRQRNGQQLVEQQDIIGLARGRRAAFAFDSGDNLYGMSGLSRRENGEGMLRNNGAEIRAGAQGEIGGPWFFTTHFGVLIDSDGGTFDSRDGWVEFSGGSRQDMEIFVIAGSPMQTMSGLAELSGKPPLPPKWTLGFLNSQWGSNESELKQIAAAYRARHIPLDAFILDFDWKAWGEDSYGEWRWNSTSGAGNFAPDKFPDGASGLFAQQLREQGVKLGGILKPRILLYKKGSTTELHEAAAYADSHHFWYPNEPDEIDYFTQRPARDLDFSKEETRTWFWKRLQPAFEAGMIAWWNDEADITSGARGQDFYFDNFQFLNMGRALYEGQRQHSDQRVWSLNRSGYIGAQRYGYAEWSGDIQTSFQSMRHQRVRMLATLNLGQPHWSMDTGGFFGHPTSENYARWIEFATFVPIDRVHGDLSERRQPWLFGPVAEAAATSAIRLRYQLLPYIYSYERGATETGIGVVRPLFWAFPDDRRFANEGAAWMFGDALLVSPVMATGETSHTIELPRGTWYDYFRGTRITGGSTISYAVDSKTWADIPVFVREGSILASQAPQEYVGQHPGEEVILDCFPAAEASSFVYYDDGGNDYAYEKGAYYRQAVRAGRDGQSIHVDLEAPTGSFTGGTHSFVIRVHGASATSVLLNRDQLPRSSAGASQPQQGQWSAGTDRFGAVTTIRVSAGHASSIVLR